MKRDAVGVCVSKRCAGENAIATYWIVSWRVLHLTYVALDNPDAPATPVFTAVEWKGPCPAIYRKKFTAGMDMPQDLAHPFVRNISRRATASRLH